MRLHLEKRSSKWSTTNVLLAFTRFGTFVVVVDCRLMVNRKLPLYPGSRGAGKPTGQRRAQEEVR